jgi:hypothetical protein
LVEGKFRAVRKADGRDKPPAAVGGFPGHVDSLAPEVGERGLDVVAHQIELVVAGAFGGVDGEFGWRQGEDQPASARVHRRHAKDVREERTDLLGLRREHDCVQPGDHVAILAGGALHGPTVNDVPRSGVFW